MSECEWYSSQIRRVMATHNAVAADNPAAGTSCRIGDRLGGGLAGERQSVDMRDRESASELIFYMPLPSDAGEVIVTVAVSVK